MSRAENQLRTFELLWTEIAPHIRADRNLPARIQQRLAKEKRFGSRDRRLYRELLYTALRHLPWLENGATAADILWLSSDTPATTPLKTACLSARLPCPATITARAAILKQQPAALLPDWFRAHCPAAFDEPNLTALHTRAPLWLRLQTDDPAPVYAEFTARGWTWRTTPAHPDALELHAANNPDLTQTDACQRGLIEIQDLGSQLILPTALKNITTPPRNVLDACAGAGGKTLQLARLLGPAARIDATDPRPAALAELRARATRANLKNIRILPTSPAPTPASDNPKSAIQNPKFTYDAVVVDAPCSGTGTWRRNPHLKYTTRETDIAAAAALQLEILTRHAPLVRPGGGALIYATCSLSRHENENVTAAFLAAPAHRDFTLVHQTTILPATHDTDGFYTATLQRTPSKNF